MPRQNQGSNQGYLGLLPKEQTEGDGRIYRTLTRLLTDPHGYTEISQLTIPPGSGIKEHRHTKDEEWYVILSDSGPELLHCSRGESHGYMNDTGKTVTIIAFKRMRG